MNWLPLNLELMRVWQNWLMIVFIVWLGGLALYLVSHPANGMESE